MDKFTCFVKHTKMTLTKKHFKNAFKRKLKSILGYDLYLEQALPLRGMSKKETMQFRATEVRRLTEEFTNTLGYAGVEWFYPVKLLITFQKQGVPYKLGKTPFELNFTSESMMRIWVLKSREEADPKWSFLFLGPSTLDYPIDDGKVKKKYWLQVFTPEEE